MDTCRQSMMSRKTYNDRSDNAPITTKNHEFHTTAWDTVKGANMTVNCRLAKQQKVGLHKCSVCVCSLKLQAERFLTLTTECYSASTEYHNWSGFCHQKPLPLLCFFLPSRHCQKLNGFSCGCIFPDFSSE